MTSAHMPAAVNGTSRDVSVGTIGLRGITPAEVPLLWGWMNEYPRSNFDDYAPKTVEEFHDEILSRIQRREIICMALYNDEPVGCIGFAPITDRLGSLHGICFSKAVHGKGLAPFAVRRFLEKVFAAGKVEKIKASYFKDNMRIKKFLRAQGFVHEGTAMAETLRAGVATDMSLVALMRSDFNKAVN